MLAIVRVTRQQLNEFGSRVARENRRFLQDITVSHLYFSPSNILFVCDEDTEIFQFPANRELSVAETIRAMVSERVKNSGYEQVTGG